MKLKDFVKKYGKPYSEILGIELKSRKNSEIIKWFLASILYAKPIRENSATKTYLCFKKHNVLSNKKILEVGWNKLVEILDEGSYTRYDFSTADKLLEVFNNLQKKYGGSLNELYKQAEDGEDLEKRLKELGRGIGDVTVSIFLRDLRGIWIKAKPKPSPLVRLAMKKFGIKNLEEFSKKKGLKPVRLETAFLKLGKDFIKKKKVIKLDL